MTTLGRPASNGAQEMPPSVVRKTPVSLPAQRVPAAAGLISSALIGMSGRLELMSCQDQVVQPSALTPLKTCAAGEPLNPENETYTVFGSVGWTTMSDALRTGNTALPAMFPAVMSFQLPTVAPLSELRHTLPI